MPYPEQPDWRSGIVPLAVVAFFLAGMVGIAGTILGWF
jgi:hypothetical protein